jgi:hypothetical protein
MVKRGLRWTGLVTLGLLLTAGCSTLVDEDEGEVLITEIPFARQGAIKASRGYVDGKPVEFFNMGTFVPGNSSWFPAYDKFPGMVVNPIYIWAGAKGLPSLDTPQLPIIDTLPLQAQYADFFEVILVSPPADYVDNDIKSRGTLLRSDLELTATGWVVNCPVVGPKMTLSRYDSKANSWVTTNVGGYRKIKVWYRKKVAYCYLMDGARRLVGQSGAPDFKINSTRLGGASGNQLEVPAGEVYTMTTSAFTGADLQSGIAVPGNDIFLYKPGQKEYTPLVRIWEVAVPSDYKLGQLTSRDDLFPVPGFDDPRITERSPEAFCNCPIRP